MQTPQELTTYKTIGRHNRQSDTSAMVTPMPYRAIKPRKSLKTLDYHADSVHDFAWFADKNLLIALDDTLQLSLRRDHRCVFSYYHMGDRQWRHSISYIKDAVNHYSAWVGEYDYPVVSALQGPGNVSSGGMEYPMITLITSPGAGKEELDGVITHEVGHNWFYGMLGTSTKREHPWMDEGINSYYEFRYEAEKYRTNDLIGSLLPEETRKLGPDEFLDAVYNLLNQLKTGEPIETPAADFPSEFDYGIVVYAKTAVWMHLLEKTLGRATFEEKACRPDSPPGNSNTPIRKT